MLGTGRNNLISRVVSGGAALKPADFGLCIEHGDKRVFARTFRHASPAWIARHIQHGGEGEGDSLVTCFACSKTGSALP